MSSEYFAHTLTALDDLAAVTSRTSAMIAAVNAHRDFKLIEVMRSAKVDELETVYLMVDVECHGVPTHNEYGLRFRERMLIHVPQDDAKATVVWSMRKDFPRLAHQNSVTSQGPAQLCLYFEPPPVVARTWTPSSFLARIQWWMEKNAKGELHLADQPLDMLFFESRHELLIPWDLDQLAARGKLSVIAAAARKNDGWTLRIVDQLPANKSLHATLVKVDLEPIESGMIEWDPHTLGQLNELLARRGADLVPLVTAAIQAATPSGGLTRQDEVPSTLVLLSVPIKRASTGEVEGITYRAFFLDGGALKIGTMLGALIPHDGRYFSSVGVVGNQPQEGWESIGLDPVTVLWENSPERARSQSGFSDAGPQGVLIGVGSLGSALLDLWVRSGWGRWTVVDKDHVRPHNLSRHTAFNSQIGLPKVLAVSANAREVTRNGSAVTPLEEDVLTSTSPELAQALRSANLVVDATADLGYPRASAVVDDRSRHVSVFVTPTGRSGVMMLEDVAKERCLRTIEAQYYRAIINSDWGRAHLEGHRGAFWSGASCRDISMVLPYSSVMIHACQFAESIPVHIANPQAAALIWQRDLSGQTEAIEIPLSDRRIHQAANGLSIYMDEGLHEHLHALRGNSLPNETGGILLGYHDFTQNLLVVVDALPAPADSKGTPASFERGVAGMPEAVAEAQNRTAGIVGYVGEWHSHPDGCPPEPSRADLVQLVELAMGMHEEGLPVIQVIVGSHDIRVVQAEVQP
ncbi:ThiF family adenylyltransferase [Stenotrophomonas rhizophila]|nr:ThiF family adenylyltransferase [Stenotrophomonas rhizophila]